MTPFERMALPNEQETLDSVHDMLLHLDREPDRTTLLEGLKLPMDTPKELVAKALELVIREEHKRYEIWRNDTYQVAIYNKDEPPAPGWPRFIHLSIKRIDREVIHDWREIQEIKNRLIGRDNEAVELYPAQSRVVDMANQYHLWVIAEPKKRFPFGFQCGFIADAIEGSISKQRPLEKGQDGTMPKL